MTTVLIVALLLLGGLLPVIGLARLAVRARRRLPKGGERRMVDYMEEGTRTGTFDIEPMLQSARRIDEEPILAWAQIRWDLALVGGGVLCSTIGSIWSVLA